MYTFIPQESLQYCTDSCQVVIFTEKASRQLVQIEKAPPTTKRKGGKFSTFVTVPFFVRVCFVDSANFLFALEF